MIWAALIAAQAMPMMPLPTEAEPAFTKYGVCLDKHVTADARIESMSAPFPRIVEDALSACRAVRARSLVEAEHALAKLQGFQDPSRRCAFLQERFGSLDEMFRAISRGEGDLDSSGNDDAQN